MSASNSNSPRRHVLAAPIPAPPLPATPLATPLVHPHTPPGDWLRLANPADMAAT